MGLACMPIHAQLQGSVHFCYLASTSVLGQDILVLRLLVPCLFASDSAGFHGYIEALLLRELWAPRTSSRQVLHLARVLDWSLLWIFDAHRRSLPQFDFPIAPPGPYATNLRNVVPWLVMEGVVVGFTEETLFRGLFLGYLVTRITRNVRIGTLRISVAGIIVAVTFSLAHAQAFWHTSLFSALGQQLYAIAIGILCAYLFEKSGSLLAPAIAHNAGDFVEWCCCFTMTALWHR